MVSVGLQRRPADSIGIRFFELDDNIECRSNKFVAFGEFKLTQKIPVEGVLFNRILTSTELQRIPTDPIGRTAEQRTSAALDAAASASVQRCPTLSASGLSSGGHITPVNSQSPASESEFSESANGHDCRDGLIPTGFDSGLLMPKCIVRDPTAKCNNKEIFAMCRGGVNRDSGRDGEGAVEGETPPTRHHLYPLPLPQPPATLFPGLYTTHIFLPVLDLSSKLAAHSNKGGLTAVSQAMHPNGRKKNDRTQWRIRKWKRESRRRPIPRQRSFGDGGGVDHRLVSLQIEDVNAGDTLLGALLRVAEFMSFVSVIFLVPFVIVTDLFQPKVTGLNSGPTSTVTVYVRRNVCSYSTDLVCNGFTWTSR
ncbi:hypothetical protein R3P38DRAFT_2804434 [Favolaschia claudopus]|uniref:Uncharacterized protein n=1 Tax=Favolaschia claudopus TaxID=2862362 RepID=A0AAV9ZR38_9AGAR